MKGKVGKTLAAIGSILVISFLVIIGCRKKAIEDYHLEDIVAED